MGNRIVSIIWGTAFALAASGFAFAADMAVKGPAPVPAPVYNWTGWYVGVNAGASFGDVKTDFNAARVRIDAGDLGIFVPGFAQSDRQWPNGFIGGGQIGYSWQYSPLIVVGLEADIQGALERDSGTFEPRKFSFDVKAGDGSGTVATSYTTQIDWFGTVRARIGYVWGNGEVMSYVTGGLAYGEVKINGTNTISASICANFFGCDTSVSGTQAFGHSHVNTGWVVGYGTEGKLATPGWTWKVEGLWMDLGTLDAAASGFTVVLHPTQQVPTGSLTGGQVTTHSHFTDGILRGGLNYKFY